jgi:IrrE N-terminal-like domain/DprA winged helix domain
VASEWSNRGAKRAREARAGLGYPGAGPLPDALEAIEGPGRAHVLLRALPADVAGAFIPRPALPLLVVNGRQALARQRFTLAHEFGHHRMGHSYVVDDQAAISGKLTHDRNEVSANAFAAEFLMPRAAVAAWGREHVRGAVTLEHVLLLASDYGVSAQAARYSLANAGILRDRSRAALLDDEIAGELHHELSRWLGLQPLADGLADAAARLPRIPAALRGSVLGDLLAGAIGVDELARRIGAETGRVSAMLRSLGLDRLVPTG